MNRTLNFLIALVFSFVFFSKGYCDTSALLKENDAIAADVDNVLSFYQLNENEKWRDITSEIIQSSTTDPNTKNEIIKNKRRIILFVYPSDGLKIKGFLSYTPNPKMHPLIILFRWGNRNFALMNPGLDIANYGDYTVISSTLRDGVSEGKDEFGGKDVNDMKNLIDFIPELAKELNIEIHPHCTFMIGPSRGGLEMFQTLARFPEIQNRITKAVALSAILDLHQQIQDRPHDMKPMFEESFGLNKNNQAQWIKERDPLNTVSKLKKTLPILIVQGTADPRINVKEGYKMLQTLKDSGHKVDYWEVKNGDHVLRNVPQAMNTISQWLEFNANCRDP